MMELTPAQQGIIHSAVAGYVAELTAATYAEQRAYTNAIEYSRENLVGLDDFVFGYLKDAVRHRSYEEIQAIERGLSRALQEITS